MADPIRPLTPAERAAMETFAEDWSKVSTEIRHLLVEFVEVFGGAPLQWENEPPTDTPSPRMESPTSQT